MKWGPMLRLRGVGPSCVQRPNDKAHVMESVTSCQAANVQYLRAVQAWDNEGGAMVSPSSRAGAGAEGARHIGEAAVPGAFSLMPLSYTALPR
jgi:hypothetical protein